MQLKLKKREDKRIRAGHAWIYSNEVDTQATPLNQFQPGQLVSLVSADGQALGSVLMSPQALICGRLWRRQGDGEITAEEVQQRLLQAQALRQQCFDQPYYRLVYGDSDRLPGLVVDRFGDYLAVQLMSAAWEQRQSLLIDSLVEAFQPKGIVWCNDVPLREQEGLESYRRVAWGDVPERIELLENQGRYQIQPLSGQKTGWFYDHRQSRKRMGQYAAGKRVLDVFSYVGAWGIEAALSGATAVTCVDSSKSAIQQLTDNAALNGVSDQVSGVVGEANQVLSELCQDKQKFDWVILDPPAFIKRRKDAKAGLQGYRNINQKALRLLKPGGYLVSASCSMHLAEAQLQEIVQTSARHVDRFVQLVERGEQGPDHPVHPAIPETRYLKAMFFRVLNND